MQVRESLNCVKERLKYPWSISHSDVAAAVDGKPHSTGSLWIIPWTQTWRHDYRCFCRARQNRYDLSTPSSSTMHCKWDTQIYGPCFHVATRLKTLWSDFGNASSSELNMSQERCRMQIWSANRVWCVCSIRNKNIPITFYKSVVRLKKKTITKM